jgi:hypothetical protein
MREKRKAQAGDAAATGGKRRHRNAERAHAKHAAKTSPEPRSDAGGRSGSAGAGDDPGSRNPREQHDAPAVPPQPQPPIAGGTGAAGGAAARGSAAARSAALLPGFDLRRSAWRVRAVPRDNACFFSAAAYDSDAAPPTAKDAAEMRLRVTRAATGIDRAALQAHSSVTHE